MQVARQGQQIVLEDLSTNGTYVDGVLVGKNRKVVLQPGSRITLVKPSLDAGLSQTGIGEAAPLCDVYFLPHDVNRRA